FAGNAHFDDASFAGCARFSNAKFQGEAIFFQAKFDQRADFASAEFGRTASFSHVRFAGEAGFTRATFVAETNFYATIFEAEASFFESSFSGAASFVGARFAKTADFIEARFVIGDVSGPMSFTRCVFGGPALFTEAILSKQPQHVSAAFSGARFADIADFRSPEQDHQLHWLAALDEAIFEKNVLLDDPREDADFDVVIARCLNEGSSDSGKSSETLLKELEGGCRVAKVAMGKARDEIKEQQFYRFQLIARRHQPTIPRTEWLASQIFSFTADYGLSLSRPL
ncbi:MAG: pentapeptide repeat-containing protein, partial [Polymorphobacter sp.]